MTLRPLHVLMTADCVGGVWTYALDLARGLAARNVRVTLATMGVMPNDAQRAEAEVFPGLRLVSGPFKLEWEPEPWVDVDRAGEWLLGLERELRPDVVHLNGYAHGNLPFIAPCLVVGHSCVLSWWQAVKGGPAPPEWDTYRKQVRAGLHGATAIVAPSQAMANALETLYGPFAFGGPLVIPNGRTMQSPAFRSRKPFVLSAGRFWDEAKNLQALLAVAPDLPLPVLVAGDCGNNVPAAPNMTALGCVPPARLAELMSEATIYALPARYEPFGLSVLEAAASGCALVLGDIPSLRENWNEAALFVPPNDTAALTTAIDRLAQNDDLHHDLARRALRRAQHFSLAAMVERYHDLYNTLLETATCK